MSRKLGGAVRRNRAKRLLREAGYPSGFDAGEMVGTVQFASAAEAVINYFAAVGIRARFRTMERVAYLSAWKDKKLRNLLFCGAGGYGNAATRIENYFVTGGTYSVGGYPDIDDLFQQQARELDRAKRQALLQRIQRLANERVLFLPIYALFFNNGVGPRVQESGLGLIPGHADHVVPLHGAVRGRPSQRALKAAGGYLGPRWPRACPTMTWP